MKYVALTLYLIGMLVASAFYEHVYVLRTGETPGWARTLAMAAVWPLGAVPLLLFDWSPIDKTE